MVNLLEKFVFGVVYVKVNLRFKVIEKDWMYNWKCLILIYIFILVLVKNIGVVMVVILIKVV